MHMLSAVTTPAFKYSGGMLSGPGALTLLLLKACWTISLVTGPTLNSRLSNHCSKENGATWKHGVGDITLWTWGDLKARSWQHDTVNLGDLKTPSRQQNRECNPTTTTTRIWKKQKTTYTHIHARTRTHTHTHKKTEREREGGGREKRGKHLATKYSECWWTGKHSGHMTSGHSWQHHGDGPSNAETGNMMAVDPITPKLAMDPIARSLATWRQWTLQHGNWQHDGKGPNNTETGNMTGKRPNYTETGNITAKEIGVPKIPSHQHSTGSVVYLKTSNQQHGTLDGGRLENEKLTFRS